MINSQQLMNVTQILPTVLTFRQPTDVVLSQFFRRQRQLGQTDRHEIAETIFSAVRHLQKINSVVEYPVQQPRLVALAALVLGRGYNLSALPDLTDEEQIFVTHVKAHKAEWSTHLSTQAELPQWLIDVLHDNQFDDDAILNFGRHAISTAPLDVRVNSLKAKRDEVLSIFQSEGFVVEKTPYSPWGIRFTHKPALNKHPLFLEGKIEVQDEGSQLLSLLTGVKRGQIAVDFCAGAGGKTLALGAMMSNTGRIYAFDVAEKRLANLKPRMVRAGLTNIHPQRIASETDDRVLRLSGKVDCVLVDAPCSGLGTLRRNPDLKYRQNREKLQELQIQQSQILQAASKLVAVGGRLVYATCSVLPQENELQIDHFLMKNKNWQIRPAESLFPDDIKLDTGVYLRLNTAQHYCDGFFAAVLERKSK